MSAPDPTPTNPRLRIDDEYRRWSHVYASLEYFYGEEPGPVARRAVRYHRPHAAPGATALDAGCGEGQDLAFLAASGYAATGIEFTPGGAEKARRLLAERSLPGQVHQEDLRTWQPDRAYDLVLAVNAIQFLGVDAPACLDRLIDAVAPGGVIGLSLFGRAPAEPEVRGTVWFMALADLLTRFVGWQCLEAAKLWQWNVAANQPQPFVTLIARNLPPVPSGPRHRLE